MKNFEERCIELDITLIKPGIQKLNPGKGRRPRNHFFKYVPKVWPKCPKNNVPTEDILKNCKNRKFFYRLYGRKFWSIRCEACKTKSRYLRLKSEKKTLNISSL